MPITVTLMLGLAILLIATVVIWRRVRKLHKSQTSISLTDKAEPASTFANLQRADLLETVSPNTAFDPDATQVYRRPNPVPVSSTTRNREGATVEVAALVGLSGSQRGKSYSVVEAGITIGRSPACDVVIDDPRVSSRHAWVGLIDGKAVLRDLESTNGTFLNTASESPIHKVELRPGDTIFFGGHQGDQFRFVAGEAQKQTDSMS